MSAPTEPRVELITITRGQYNADLARARAEGAREALIAAADEHEAELVCCDVYERLSKKGWKHWTDTDRAEYRSHSACYWSAACAQGDRDRAAALPARGGAS